VTWSDGGEAGDLASLMEMHFLRPKRATIYQLVASITPRVKDAVELALAAARDGPVDSRDEPHCTHAWRNQVVVPKDIPPEVRVLANAAFLQVVLQNLIRNAMEAVAGTGAPASPIEVTCEDPGDGYFTIGVLGGVLSPELDPEEFFRKPGALRVHRIELDAWGGSLFPRVSDDRRLALYVRLLRVPEIAEHLLPEGGD